MCASLEIGLEQSGKRSRIMRIKRVVNTMQLQWHYLLIQREESQTGLWQFFNKNSRDDRERMRECLVYAWPRRCVAFDLQTDALLQTLAAAAATMAHNNNCVLWNVVLCLY